MESFDRRFYLNSKTKIWWRVLYNLYIEKIYSINPRMLAFMTETLKMKQQQKQQQRQQQTRIDFLKKILEFKYVVEFERVSEPRAIQNSCLLW